MFEAGFIGCGHMGGALALAAAQQSQSLALSNPTRSKAEALSKTTGATVTDNATVAAESRFILLGVKPQKLPAVLSEIAPVLRERRDHFVLVSMAAGVRLEQVQTWADGYYPVIRMMPNTAVAIGEGMVQYALNGAVTPGDETDFRALFTAAGRMDKLPEALIDASCAVSGCGPAFVYMMIQAMADGGVACGLSRDKAVTYAAQTVIGAGQMVLTSGQHPEALKDAVCSPAGSTIAGVEALEDNAFRGAVMDAVAAAFERTRELGQGK